jgi:hypothetical protein
VILCTKWRHDGKYYIMDSYKILNWGIHEQRRKT